MNLSDSTAGDSTGTPEFDVESAEWLSTLNGSGAQKEEAVGRLYAQLLQIARAEVRRRSGHLRVAGVELDDIAHQAAADALVRIMAKLAQFRGESRFTTWAYKFVIFEVSTKTTRHFWRRPSVSMDSEDWDRLPDRFGMDPATQPEWRELISALRTAVDQKLTARQRQIFVAIVLNGVPLDVLVAELGSTRNAIYKVLFDARRKLRAELVANGQKLSTISEPSTSRRQ